MRRFPRVILVLVALALSAGLVFAEKTCPNCGTENKDSDKFCKSCGAKLPEARPSPPAPPRVAGSISVEGSTVSITSEPSGAGVAVDGRNRGKTPLELNDMAPGRHEVELTRSGYRAYYGEFTIAGLFGSMVVTTDPVGAEVLLDGVSRGRTGDEGLALTRVPYGRHTITARLQEYNDVVKSVDIKSAGPIGVTCRLGFGKGFLRVESDPSGASLLMNNQPVGKTPYVAELVPARYALAMSRRGYYDWSGSADVQYSESTAVRAVLDRMETRKLPFLILAIAGVGAGVGATVQGGSEYEKYKAATTPEDAERYHNSTMTWDIGRYVAFGASIALAGLYWTLEW
jgi:hypothetical protein